MKGRTTNFGEQSRGRPASAARGSPLPGGTRRVSCARAFTLAEVMIALGIFFMVVFAILGLVSNALRNARTLQRRIPDAGMAATLYLMTVTNDAPGGLVTGEFGESYRDFFWTADPQLYRNITNLYQVDIIVQRRSGGRAVMSQMSMLQFLPNAKINGVGLPNR